jgi:hypothetical protein
MLKIASIVGADSVFTFMDFPAPASASAGIGYLVENIMPVR